MFCSRCGVDVPPGAAFCAACGSKISGPADDGPALKRPPLITVLAVLQFVGAALCLLMAVATLAAVAAGDAAPVEAVFGGLVFAGFGVLGLACGLGLLRVKPYGRTLQLAFAWIGLVVIPIGTIVAILILVYLFKPGIKLLFSGRPAAELGPDERAQIAAVSQGSQAIVVVVVLLALGAVLVLAMVAAIAVPGLLRARISANEASAVASLRTISSAQAAFAATCGNGFYAPTLASLATPPAGRQEGFISPDLAGTPQVRSGYTITLTAGAPAGDAPAACNGAAVVATYFVEAAPVTPGSTGTRFFAANQGGTIFSSSSAIAVSQTGAPENAEPVR